MLLAGLAVSGTLLKESGARVERARRIYGYAKTIEEGIRYARAPIPSVIDSRSLKELEESDEEAGRLVEDICSSDYGAALNYAVYLRNHTEKEMQRAEEEERARRPMMAYLPPAAAALAVILLL